MEMYEMQKMNRRDAIRRVSEGGLGLMVLATVRDLVMPNKAEAVEVSVRDGRYNGDGVSIDYFRDGRPVSEREKFQLYVSSDGKARLGGIGEASVGFGKGKNYHQVRAQVGEAEMILRFGRSTKYGGFDINKEKEVVLIKIKAGGVGIYRDPKWRLQVPVLLFEGQGTVQSGSNFIEVDGGRIVTNSNFLKGYRGSTPIVVRTRGGQHEYHFSRGGGIRKLRNADLK